MRVVATFATVLFVKKLKNVYKFGSVKIGSEKWYLRFAKLCGIVALSAYMFIDAESNLWVVLHTIFICGTVTRFMFVQPPPSIFVENRKDRKSAHYTVFEELVRASNLTRDAVLIRLRGRNAALYVVKSGQTLYGKQRVAVLIHCSSDLNVDWLSSRSLMISGAFERVASNNPICVVTTLEEGARIDLSEEKGYWRYLNRVFEHLKMRNNSVDWSTFRLPGIPHVLFGS